MEDPLVTVQELAVSVALSGRNESSEDPRYSGSNLRKKKRIRDHEPSVKALLPTEYIQGLRNPRTGFPAARRASLTRVMTEAAVGVAALKITGSAHSSTSEILGSTYLVPSSGVMVPFHIVRK
jgi:hypothetical protein